MKYFIIVLKKINSFVKNLLEKTIIFYEKRIVKKLAKKLNCKYYFSYWYADDELHTNVYLEETQKTREWFIKNRYSFFKKTGVWIKIKLLDEIF